MKKYILIVGGGGARTASYYMGCKRQILKNGATIIYELVKSGPGLPAYISNKVGIEACINFFVDELDGQREVYRRDIWGLIKWQNIYKYSPLRKKLERFQMIPNKNFWDAVSFDTRTGKQVTGNSINHVIATASIDGVFADWEGLVDLGLSGMPNLKFIEDYIVPGVEIIFINGHNNAPYKRGNLTEKLLNGQIAYPLAAQAEAYWQKLSVWGVQKGIKCHHIEMQDQSIDIRDYYAESYALGITEGEKNTREVIGGS